MNFSVIIPTRNRNTQLFKLLQSIDRNHFTGRLEIIIIDSGTKNRNGTHNLNYHFINSLCTLRIFKIEDRGPSFARNVGISKAKWKHIIFVDDDCTFENNFFQTYQMLWKKYPKAKIIGGRVKPVSETGTFTTKQLSTIHDYYGSFGITMLGDKERHIQLGELVYTANMSYHLSGSRDTQIFNERLGRRITNTLVIYAEDYELCSKTLLSNEKIIYSPLAVVCNHISFDRFTTGYLKRRAFVSGMEQALMEKILNDAFNNTYEKASICNMYITAIRDACKGKNIRGCIKLFNSKLKVQFAFSYLFNKLYIYR